MASTANTKKNLPPSTSMISRKLNLFDNIDNKVVLLCYQSVRSGIQSQWSWLERFLGANTKAKNHKLL